MPDTLGPSVNLATQHGISRLLLPALLIASVIAIYFPLVQFPFVQDDWAVLHAMTFRPVSAFLLEVITPGTALFYRPLGFAYCAIVYSLFGLHPIGFHLLSLLLLIISSFLVMHIGERITGDARIAWGSGFVFAAAASVHLETQLWLVGIFDIGSTASSLLCIALFLHRKYGLSALALGAALAFKESAVTLPLILVVQSFVSRTDDDSRPGTLRALFSRLRPHGAVFLIYAIIMAFSSSLFSLPTTHPYYMRVFAEGVRQNVLQYAQWGLEAVTPMKSIAFSPSGSHLFLVFVTAGMAIVYILIVRRALKHGADLHRSARILLAMTLWFLLALLPAAAVVNHPNKYYMTIMLPPVAIGAFLFLKAVLSPFGRNARILGAACVVFALSDVIDGMLFIQRQTSLGLREGAHATSWGGENHLIRKASVVHATWKPLLSLFPTLPERSVLVFRYVETEAFASAMGPQVWYGDSTLLVGDLIAGIEHGSARLALPPRNPWDARSSPTVIDVPVNRVFLVRGIGEMMEREKP